MLDRQFTVRNRYYAYRQQSDGDPGGPKIMIAKPFPLSAGLVSVDWRVSCRRAGWSKEMRGYASPVTFDRRRTKLINNDAFLNEFAWLQWCHSHAVKA
jgi:hypothetical protein